MVVRALRNGCESVVEWLWERCGMVVGALWNGCDRML